MAGFGVIIFALDFSIPPAAGENVGAGELVDAAMLGAQDEPAVFVRMIRAAGETLRLCRDALTRLSTKSCRVQKPTIFPN